MKIDYVNFLNYAGVHFRPDNGRQINFLDYAQHFLKNENVSNIFIFQKQPKYIETFTDFTRNVSISNLRTIRKNFAKFYELDYFNQTKADVLICDFVVFSFLIINNVAINKYRKIFIFDCLELTLFLKSIDNQEFNTCSQKQYPLIKEFIKNYNEKIFFLGTDYNIPDFKKSNMQYIKYYKKINFEIFNVDFINQQEIKYELIYYYAPQNLLNQDSDFFIKCIKNKYPNIKITSDFMEVWQSENILYTVKPYVNYIEQFGRMIFELREFNYNVIIDNSFKKEKKTGLEYYLEYYKKNDINIINEDFIGIINEYI